MKLSLFKRVCLALFCVIAFAFYTPGHAASKKKPNANSNLKLKAEDVRLFSHALAQINRYYIKSVDSRKLLENAIQGMLKGLDPHSAFLNKKHLKDLLTNTSGRFVGVGIEITPEHGFIKIVSPIDGSPAKKAGIKSGDYIVEINKQPVSEMTMSKVINSIRGKEGTRVKLTLLRKGKSKPFEVNVLRKKMDLVSVKYKLLENGYGYLRISQFQHNTAKEVRKAIKKLKRKAPLSGLIVDLRNNPGGVLNSAVDVSDIFLDSKELHQFKKRIVYTKGRIKGSTIEAKATPGSAIKNLPLIVLINEGSASASEIVAGALQDYKRALIVGKGSFGKGSVQTVIPVGQNEAVKITTALYYTPAGREIQAKGITPDVIVENLPIKDLKTEAVVIAPIKEYRLRGHITGKNETKPMTKIQRLTLAKEDYTLYQALLILKTMSMMNFREDHNVLEITRR
jgi:carboxyl-terminal processing protease